MMFFEKPEEFFTFIKVGKHIIVHNGLISSHTSHVSTAFWHLDSHQKLISLHHGKMTIPSCSFDFPCSPSANLFSGSKSWCLFCVVLFAWFLSRMSGIRQCLSFYLDSFHWVQTPHAPSLLIIVSNMPLPLQRCLLEEPPMCMESLEIFLSF